MRIGAKTTRLVLKFIVIVLASSCRRNSVGPQPPQPPDTTSHDFTWRYDTLGTYPSNLNDVWGAKPNDVYAVGYVHGQPGKISDYMMHFDGISWQTISDTSLLYGLGAGGLNGIHGLSDKDIIIVGTGTQGQGFTGFIGKWDGIHWRNVTPSGIRPLNTVWMRSENDIFAAGDGGYVIHYNGVRWDSLASGTTLDIWRIFALPTGEVYGVASNYWQSPQGSVILRIDSTEVTTEQTVVGRSLFAVWGDSKSNLYVVGEGVFHKGFQGGWQELPVQRPSTTLFGIGAIKGSDVLIGGYLQTLLHWNGASWKFFDSVYDPTGSINIDQIRPIGDTYFLVGTAGSLAFTAIGKHS